MAEKKEQTKNKKSRWWVTLLVGIGLFAFGTLASRRYSGLGGWGDIAYFAGIITILYVPYEIYKNSKKK